MSVISTMLLIQADPGLRAALSFGFEREGIEVVTADLGEDEIGAVVASARPQLVIAGVIAGAKAADAVETLTAIREALAKADLHTPVLYIGNGVKREQALSEGAAEVIDGPGYVRDVVTLGKLLASRKSRGSTKSSGQLSDHFGLFYLLRAVSRSSQRCVLTLVRGLRRGELRFYDGEVTSASVGVLHGLAALHQLLLWTDASFELRAEDVSPRRQIPLRPDEVIADAERFLLEVKEVAGSISPAFVYEHVPDVDPDALDAVPRQIGSVHRLFDGSRKVADVIEDSPFRMFETLRIANRLCEAGLIRRVQTKPRRPRAYTALSIEEWLSGTGATIADVLVDKSEPIGPKLGEPASPPRKQKRKKGKRKKNRKSREIQIAKAVSAPGAQAAQGKKKIDWSDVLPKRAQTEPGQVTGVVPSTSASGVIAESSTVEPSAQERPSVLVSAAITSSSAAAAPPTRESALEAVPETVGKLFSADKSVADAAADEATEMARRGTARSASGEIGGATPPTSVSGSISADETVVVDPEDSAKRKKSVTVNFDRPTGESSEPSILVDPGVEADEAAAAQEKADDEAAVAAAAQKKADDEAAAVAQKKADDEAAVAAAAQKKADDEAAVAAAAQKKADDEAVVAAAQKKADDEAAAAAQKKVDDDAAAAAAVQKEAEDEAAAAVQKKADDEAAAAAVQKKADDEAVAASAKKKADDKAAAASAKKKAAKKAKKKGTKPSAPARALAADGGDSKTPSTDIEPGASASLPDLSKQPASAVEKLAADAATAAEQISAFSEDEEAFFRAGKEIAETKPPPLESFDDLDDGYDLPKTFWQRLLRRPGETGKNPSDDD